MKKKVFKWIGVIVLCVACFLAGHYQALAGASEQDKEMRKFQKVYNILTNDWYYADQVDNLEETLMENAISGMSTLDKDEHTNYLSLEQTKLFSESLSGSQVGLGVQFDQNADGNLVIRHVYVNSAADQAGLQPGDIITQINKKVVSSMDADEIVSYIQSQKKITIHYQRDGESQTVEVKPTNFDSTVALELHDDYAYMIISSFSSQTGEDVAEAMQRVKDAGIKKLVLDLRDNTGGYLSAAQDVGASLLPEGSVLFIEHYADGSTKKQYVSSDYEQVKMDQIVILQNGETASASEALIGALKDQLGDTVTTVGTTTYGKGTEQAQEQFDDGTELKYTVAEWYTPKNKSINKKGFKPDHKVKPLAVAAVKYKKFKKKDVIEPNTVKTNAKALQTYLQYLGYPVDRTDSYFDQAGSEALKQFQTDHGLEATGTCDKKTWDAVVEAAKYKYNDEGYAADPQYQEAIQLTE
ncbi:S41 family peptidase [Catenisphaera adipataccumulans]|uniref:Carboxyl-terminal processing protease n=1 Tax=Catenisphaera adipataccumulans TaxID=700500 RepID=A0A7W8D026_9FIRM|nr:S41 family peptidase [Catenisphaera adipataccumulans]MBB5183497.1 carboxyl-terminal processing protease [Catenisphaera adipataccumulans]